MKKILEIKNISKRFGSKDVLNKVSMDLYEGEIVGIIGRNGSGKTVLLKIIAGLYSKNEGIITYPGIKLNDMGIFIDMGFLPNRTGLDNLNIVSSLCKEKITKEKCCNLLKTVGLNPFDKTKYKNYSTGMKQRLALAYTLMEDPKLLILDEPFSGIDSESVQDFRKLLLSLKEKKKTILITSHYQEDIDLLCDRVYKMTSGKLIEASNEKK